MPPCTKRKSKWRQPGRSARWHALRGEIDPAVVADWIARFKSAELLPTVT